MSSHTFCPLMNGMNVFFLLSTILLWASSWAARASSLSSIIPLICSSMDAYLVCLNVVGIATRDSPYKGSNGVHNQSACRQLLCVNLSIGIT